MSRISLDRSSGVVPTVVTASLDTTGLTSWVWCLDEQPVGPADTPVHTFTLDRVALFNIGVRWTDETGATGWDAGLTVLVTAAPPLAVVHLDKTTVSAGDVITASLTSSGLTTWRWLLDGAIHKDANGQADNQIHEFILPAGMHTIGLRTMPTLDVWPQTVTVHPVVEAPPPTRFWGLQTFELIPAEWAAEISRRLWGWVRVEGTNYDPIMAQCRKHSLWPLWILRRNQEASVPSGITVEIGNECNAGCAPDWPNLDPMSYAAWVLEAWPVLQGKGCVVYVGAANNTSPAGISWTKDVLSRLPMHSNLRVSFHRYPDGDQDPLKPKKDFKTLADENQAILDCVKGRRWAISEAGLLDCTYRDWSSWKYFGKKRTRLAVEEHLKQAKRFRDLGADFYIVYQMQGEYGIRQSDGIWKPTAELPLLAG